jgi:hypothetical protein
MDENERIAGASSVGDDRIFWNEMKENEIQPLTLFASMIILSTIN